MRWRSFENTSLLMVEEYLKKENFRTRNPWNRTKACNATSGIGDETGKLVTTLVI